MKDIEKLAKECIDELEAVGIKCGKVRSFSVNTRAKKRWGRCKALPDGTFEINISERLLNQDAQDRFAKQTIIHELLHTVDGCFTHTGKWKIYAEYVNQRYPQYNIKRATSYEEMGQKPPEQTSAPQKNHEFRYVLRCKKCNEIFGRQVKSRAVTYYKRYRCSKCGGKLERLL